LINCEVRLRVVPIATVVLILARCLLLLTLLLWRARPRARAPLCTRARARSSSSLARGLCCGAIHATEGVIERDGAKLMRCRRKGWRHKRDARDARRLCVLRALARTRRVLYRAGTRCWMLAELQRIERMEREMERDARRRALFTTPTPTLTPTQQPRNRRSFILAHVSHERANC
jgi:hypothetical protein